jgi:hypothetical protein
LTNDVLVSYTKEKIPIIGNSYLRYKCKKLSFIARTGDFCDFLNCDSVTSTSACVDRHVLPALFSTQFVNKVYEFKTPFVKL